MRDLGLHLQGSFQILFDSPADYPAFAFKPFRTFDFFRSAIGFQDSESRTTIIIRLVATRFVQMSKGKRQSSIRDLIDQKVNQDRASEIRPVGRVIGGDND